MAECVFCSCDRPLTAEHVIPAWVGALLPVSDPRARRIRDLGRGATPAEVRQSIQERDEGPLGLETVVKKVCAYCNNGWMSALETDVKPLIRGVMLGAGNPGSLDKSGQLAIAQWAIKTAMMLEFTGPARGFSRSQRHALFALRQSRGRPLNTGVWLGRIKSGSRRGYFHRVIKWRLCDPGAPHNVQQTTAVLGGLIVVVQSHYDLRWWSSPRSALDGLDGLLRLPTRPSAALAWPEPLWDGHQSLEDLASSTQAWLFALAEAGGDGMEAALSTSIDA